MYSMLLASLPLVLPAALMFSASSATAIPASGVQLAQAQPAETMPQSSEAESQESLPLRYPYVAIQAGVGFPGDLNGKYPNPLQDFVSVNLPKVKVGLDLSTGFNGEVAVGYKFPDVRTDLSVGFSSFSSATETKTVTNVNGEKLSNSQSGRGTVELLTIMANAYYDFKIKKQDGTPSRWSPYVGAGIGWGHLSTPGCATPGCQSFSAGTASTFAYQAKLGVSYRATEAGFVFLEGGYLGTSSADVSTVSYDPFGAWRLNLGWRQKL